MDNEQRPAPLHIFGAANPEQNEQLARDAQAALDAAVVAMTAYNNGWTPGMFAAAPQVVADERAAFETEMSKLAKRVEFERYNERRAAHNNEQFPAPQFEPVEVGDYVLSSVQVGWKMWQARAALAGAPVQAQEPVGTIVAVRTAGVMDCFPILKVQWARNMPQEGTELYAAPAAQGDAKDEEAMPEPPTVEQFKDWCERHDLREHLHREAFDDAASLYLLDRAAIAAKAAS